jgi:transcriptional regulator with XRE-family HTH domain
MVETMADRLRQLKGRMSYEDFGALAGVSAQAVQKWMSGGNVTDKNLLQLVAHEPFKSRGVTVEWIRYGISVVAAEPAPAGKYLYPRKYENVVAGLGLGRFNEDYTVEIGGTIAVPAWLIQARGWRIERLAVINTDGRSMYPTLGEDEPVVVNLEDTRLADNKIFAIEDADEGVRIKRLIKQRDGRILVRSDNPDKFSYPDDYITPDSGTRIVARVCYRAGEL